MRVLLVEDDDGDALIVEEELELSGARVDAARAPARWPRPPAPTSAGYDCVLLDLNLPDAAGARRAARAARAAPDLAVLVLTGLDDERRGVEAVAAGAQDYLVKGATSGVLLGRSLRYAVERRRAELTQQQLSIAQLEARENARLERGLLPDAARHRPGAARSPPTTARAAAARCSAATSSTRCSVPDGTVHAVIGDVCGHGPDEAALGVCLRIAWRTLVLAGVAGRRRCSRGCRTCSCVERHADARVHDALHGLARARPRRRRRSGSPATRRRCCSPDGRRRAARARPARAAARASSTTRAGRRYDVALPAAGRCCSTPTA